jgi:hypothetical protein
LTQHYQIWKEVTAVKDNVSAARGSSVSHTTEQLLAHNSAFKIPEHFRGYPKADECIRQDTHQKRSIIATCIPEKNALMEKKRPSKGKGPKITFQEK